MKIKKIEPEIVFDDLCEDCEWKRKYEALAKRLDNCLRVGIHGVLQRPTDAVYLVEADVRALLEDDDE